MNDVLKEAETKIEQFLRGLKASQEQEKTLRSIYFLSGAAIQEIDNDNRR